MRNLSAYIKEGFYSNIGEASLVPLINTYTKQKGYRANSVITATIIWLLYKNGYLTKEEVSQIPLSSNRLYIGGLSGVPRNTIYSSDYVSKVSVRPNYKEHFIRPVISSMTAGMVDNTREFTEFLDFLHIKYTEGSDKTGRQTSKKYNFIKIDPKR